eukprot:1143324-Pelagomonas_calceolata.AAC.6
MHEEASSSKQGRAAAQNSTKQALDIGSGISLVYDRAAPCTAHLVVGCDAVEGASAAADGTVGGPKPWGGCRDWILRGSTTRSLAWKEMQATLVLVGRCNSSMIQVVGSQR